jgi:4-hydroxybenzoate polyprenyltransferase
MPSGEIQEADALSSKIQGSLRDYIAIARFDHSTKHVFIVPGILIAFALRHPPVDHIAISIFAGFCSAIAIASANYVINEWLDREFDAFHPQKSGRTAVNRVLSARIIYLEYAMLVLIGLALAYWIGMSFFYVSLLFVLSGLTYNVKPLRTKDRPYVDVVSESINNPIRLALGWTMVDPVTLPPSSLLLGYWMIGAFLMTAKRLSEYREISEVSGVETLKLYRRSLGSYTSESLMISCLVYAMFSAFFIAIFLIKYRLEYVLAFPFIAAMFAVYLWLAFQKGSVAQRPERLFHSRRMMFTLGMTILVLVITSFVNLPILEYLSSPSFIAVRSSG